MDEQLLVRVYDVGFGDCIYVRIPDGEGYFHLLIDCGTSASADPAKNPALKNAVDDVRSMLPLEEDGKRRLDLLVATHPHADHIKGFDPDWFQDVRMKQIWLSAFIQPDHPQAKKMQAFQDAADRAAGALLSRPGLFLAPGARALLQRSIWNPGALKALRTEFAQSSGIFPDYPLYVARDLAGKLSPEQLDRYGLDSEKGTTRFRGFAEAGTSLRVLAPEWDIDKYYLGQGDFDENHALLDARILETDAYKPAAEALDGTVGPAGAEPDGASGPDQPINISASDYRRLKNRLLYSALAFAQKDDALKNNTSVVLLLEWRKKRLLFTGDAEWHGAGVEEDRRNSTWDVMLANPEVEQLLLQPLDVTQEADAERLAALLAAQDDGVELAIHAAGILHEGDLQPEKSVARCDPARVLRLFEVNSIGPLLTARAVLQAQPRRRGLVFAAISAMVGSIGDNRLGGWYGYRASKAALNQFMRTLANECRLSHPRAAIVTIHPGTTDTALSQPFQRNLAPGKLYTTEQTAERILGVLEHLGPADSGRFFNWDGSEIPW